MVGAAVLRHQRRQFLHLAAGAGVLPALSRIASAQSYPTRPVRWTAPVAPGDMPDVLARLLCLVSREITRAAHCVNSGSSACRWEVENDT